jgi:AraC-like DNA-binding protein
MNGTSSWYSSPDVIVDAIFFDFLHPVPDPVSRELRRKIRARARRRFNHDILLQGTSVGIRRLETEMLRAPEGWPLLLIAEPGSGVANWLIAFHIAASPDPEPLKLENAGRFLRSADPFSTALERWFSDDLTGTCGLLRLDLLSEAQLGELTPWLQDAGSRVVCAAQPSLGASGGEPNGNGYEAAGFRTVLTLPPLRDRPEDIEPLLLDFLRRQGFPTPLELDPEALAHCLDYAWPGNERQLARFIARLAGEAGDGKFSLEQVAEIAPELFDAPMSRLHPSLQRAVQHIWRNSTEKLTLSSVARAAFASTSHLSHLFRTELQTSFTTFLSELRVRNAKRLIRAQPERPLEVHALYAGFTSLRQMERHFQKRVREPPSEYRQRYCRANHRN